MIRTTSTMMMGSARLGSEAPHPVQGARAELEARGRGQGRGETSRPEKYYPGKIKRPGDGTYDIAPRRRRARDEVEERLIKKDGGGSDSFREGDKIEADYRGRSRAKLAGPRGRHLRRRLRRRRRETRVSSACSLQGRWRKLEFEEGDKVEARYRGREKYYPGKITRDRGRDPRRITTMGSARLESKSA